LKSSHELRYLLVTNVGEASEKKLKSIILNMI